MYGTRPAHDVLIAELGGAFATGFVTDFRAVTVVVMPLDPFAKDDGKIGFIQCSTMKSPSKMSF